MLDVSEKFSGTVVMLDDFTEKKANEKQLEEQQKALIIAERQRVMMESLGAATHHLSSL